MRPFSRRPCEKCGSSYRQVEMRYYCKGDMTGCPFEEHLHHECLTCGYGWITAPKAPEAPPEKVGCAACLHSIPCPRTKSAKEHATDIILERLITALQGAITQSNGLPLEIRRSLKWPAVSLWDLLYGVKKFKATRS